MTTTDTACQICGDELPPGDIAPDDENGQSEAQRHVEKCSNGKMQLNDDGSISDKEE